MINPLSQEYSSHGCLIALVGPTASGKTEIALEIASLYSRIELVSIDSMTIYRGMNIGTAKPTPDELGKVSYHLIDVTDPWNEYSVSEFQADASEILKGIEARLGIPMLVGGTGLYYQAVVDGLTIPGRWPDIRDQLELDATGEDGISILYSRLQRLDPLAASRMEPGNIRRIVRALEVTLGSGKPFSQHGPGLFSVNGRPIVAIGIDIERSELYKRIQTRLDEQLAAGWLDEVRRLLDDPRGFSRTAKQALGYKELIAVVNGELSLLDARDQIFARTKRFAKRQSSWFKRDNRITWFSSLEEVKRELVSIVSKLD